MTRQKKRSTVLKKIAYMKGIERKDVAKAVGISEPTVTHYFRNPHVMDADMRAKVAKALRVEVEFIDDVANGKVTDASQLIKV